MTPNGINPLAPQPNDTEREQAGDTTFTRSKSLWPLIAKLADEVIREQGLASVDKTMDADLYRFLHYLQEKVEGRE